MREPAPGPVPALRRPRPRRSALPAHRHHPGLGHAKIRQRLYWGSPAWITSFNRRTYIEGVFGNMSPKTENVRRGWTFVVGIVKTGLMVACVTAATNLRLLRGWARRVDDHTDPLTVLDPDDPGFEELDPVAGGSGILGPPLAA